ncbi:DUF7309 domain-containing protein [Paenibacillus koleovorans]|uniref:DUF7309 domain-containing protein n=1 Tax=Paenibacillus koleovorans TaxID=121608 RepID=UPI000FD70FC0|nr:hypothetical protein [Paenibacillus koleovorans]
MKPTTEQWSKLYVTAATFKQAGCWDWMENIHLFGVQDPDSDRVGYCCIMGNGGELYGLAVYIGTAGLKVVSDMLLGRSETDSMFSQHCLMLAFEDREDLMTQERAQIKELGLKFRGRQAWPTFRLNEPGYYPWPLMTTNDVNFLTVAIEQAMEVSRLVRDNPDQLLDVEEGFIVTRVSSTNEADERSWSTEKLKPADIEQPSIEYPELNAFQMAQLKKTVKQKQYGVWEIGCFYLPSPVMEGDRPYYPMVLLAVDGGSGQILTAIVARQEEMAAKAISQLIQMLEQLKGVPSELVSLRQDAFGFLAPLVAELKLRCAVVERTPAWEEAVDGMLEMMMAR